MRWVEGFSGPPSPARASFCPSALCFFPRWPWDHRFLLGPHHGLAHYDPLTGTALLMACPCLVRTKSRACAVSWSGPASSSARLSRLLLPLLVVPCACRGAAGSGVGRRRSASFGVPVRRCFGVAVVSGRPRPSASSCFSPAPCFLPVARLLFLPSLGPSLPSRFLPVARPLLFPLLVFSLRSSLGRLLCVGGPGAGRSSLLSSPCLLCCLGWSPRRSLSTEAYTLTMLRVSGGMAAVHPLTMFQYLSG